MTTYQSSVKHISASSEAVFAKLTDLKLLEPLYEQAKSQIPADKVEIKDVIFNPDSIYITVNPVGTVGLKIVEQEPFKTVKFASDNSPLDFNLWIQLVEKEPLDTKMRITLKADIPFIIKTMYGSKIEQGLEAAAERLATIQY